MTITTLTERIQARDGVAVVVFTKPDCVQCKQTFRMLDRASIYYTTVDITEDAGALAYIKRPVEDGGLGYLAAPVVVVAALPDGEQEDWSGFRPDLIKTHITERDDGDAIMAAALADAEGQQLVRDIITRVEAAK